MRPSPGSIVAVEFEKANAMTLPRDPAAKDSTTPPAPAADPKWDDDDGPWRHEQVAPKDESAAESLGRSVSDVVTGPQGQGDEKNGKRKKTP
jgi:hypothetical protein